MSIYSRCMNFVQRRLFFLLFISALDATTQKKSNRHSMIIFVLSISGIEILKDTKIILYYNHRRELMMIMQVVTLGLAQKGTTGR